ncbi:MAG: tetratricopeptide repeat protein, partial [Thermodesulfobacteriota bacterium]|nr:tetratricopeptide repeat protein [Thermodesulfobacteriota bacterium]
MKRIMNPLNLFLVVTCLLLPGRSKGVDDFLKQGTLFLESRQYDAAIKSFSHAITINPQHAVAYCNRGVAWFYKGDYDRAISDYDRALAINPHYTGAYCNRGVLWTNKGDYDRAISDYEKALDMDTSYAPAYCGRGLAWFHKGDYNRAIADYNRTIDIDPHHTMAYCNRGALWASKGDYDRAIADCTRALDLNPYSAMAHCNRGVAWYHKGEYFRAIADYLRAIDIDPYHTEAYSHLAWTLAICPDDRYRNGNKAMEMAQKAVELNPKVDFLATLAAACAEAGKFEEAITTQKRVITLLNKECKNALLDEHMERLKAYKARKPLREKYAIRSQKTNKEVFKAPTKKIEEEAYHQLRRVDASLEKQ